MEIMLEEPFKSMYRKGYLRTETDGRKYVSLYNKPGDQRSISYARYLYSVKLGYEVPEGIEIDHGDGDKSNDDINNLRPLTQGMHREKTYVIDGPKEQIVDLTCPHCKIIFQRSQSYCNSKTSQGQSQFFCSRSCSTKSNGQVGVPISESLVNEIKTLRANNKSSYYIAEQLNLSRNTVMKYW